MFTPSIMIKKLSSNRYFVIGLQIVLFIALYWGVRSYTQRDLVQNRPPEINAPLISGEVYQLQQANPSPRLLHFWATWCGICSLEQDSIESLSKDYPIITIAMQSGENKELQQFMRDEKLTFPVISDSNGQIASQFGVKAVPVSFILNHQGEIVFTESGFTSSWGLRARLWLANYF